MCTKLQLSVFYASKLPYSSLSVISADSLSKSTTDSSILHFTNNRFSDSYQQHFHVNADLTKLTFRIMSTTKI